MLIFSPQSRSSSKARPFGPARGRGFTLIELMVVVAIMTILTAVLLLQQKKFDSSTLLRSLAYSVALSVQQAQTYGTSVRQFGTSLSGFSYSYGVSFTTGDLTTNNSYTLFADTNSNGLYDSASGEQVQQFRISPGYGVVKFCGIVNSSTQDCSDGSGGGTQISSLGIYFKRPSTDAQFATDAVGHTYCAAYVEIDGPDQTNFRNIEVTTAGQILVTGLNATVSGC
ncbi:MAG TPA: prepilin-type N-terminal cleavage/methylation domain-containing protein [Candidatus Paceibacterota bacterium]|nr:prepilin-type N-terminal cleavage/methylation domain-containing protein [Candidatus Paceibacterota bacterium]